MYRDQESSQWKYTGNFNRDDLLPLAKVADLAHTRIHEIQGKLRARARAAEEQSSPDENGSPPPPPHAGCNDSAFFLQTSVRSHTSVCPRRELRRRLRVCVNQQARGVGSKAGQSVTTDLLDLSTCIAEGRGPVVSGPPVPIYGGDCAGPASRSAYSQWSAVTSSAARSPSAEASALGRGAAAAEREH